MVWFEIRLQWLFRQDVGELLWWRGGGAETTIALNPARSRAQ